MEKRRVNIPPVIGAGQERIFLIVNLSGFITLAAASSIY
jgi:hypothetical protein